MNRTVVVSIIIGIISGFYASAFYINSRFELFSTRLIDSHQQLQKQITQINLNKEVLQKLDILDSHFSTLSHRMNMLEESERMEKNQDVKISTTPNLDPTLNQDAQHLNYINEPESSIAEQDNNQTLYLDMIANKFLLQEVDEIWANKAEQSAWNHINELTIEDNATLGSSLLNSASLTGFSCRKSICEAHILASNLTHLIKYQESLISSLSKEWASIQFGAPKQTGNQYQMRFYLSKFPITFSIN